MTAKKAGAKLGRASGDSSRTSTLRVPGKSYLMRTATRVVINREHPATLARRDWRKGHADRATRSRRQLRCAAVEKTEIAERGEVPDFHRNLGFVGESNFADAMLADAGRFELEQGRLDAQNAVGLWHNRCSRRRERRCVRGDAAVARVRDVDVAGSIDDH